MNKRQRKNNKDLLTKYKHDIMAVALLLTAAAVMMAILMIAVPSVQNNSRKDRILNIISSLHLDPKQYAFQSEYIHGHTMTLDWTIGDDAIYSRKYVRNTTVSNTVQDVRRIAADAGLVSINDQKNANSVYQLDYTTSKNENVRFYISSKLRDDAIYNNPDMNQSQKAAIDQEANSAPTNVIVDINLNN